MSEKRGGITCGVIQSCDEGRHRLDKKRQRGLRQSDITITKMDTNQDVDSNPQPMLVDTKSESELFLESEREFED